MTTKANYITEGRPDGNSTLNYGDIGNLPKSQNNVLFGRVLSINEERIITFEYLNNNFSPSKVGTSVEGQTAYPSSNTIVKLPVIGEIVKLFNGPEPFSTSTNPSQYVQVIYYETQPLNAWQDVNNNVVLNNTTPQNISQGNDVNININSYINSSNGF